MERQIDTASPRFDLLACICIGVLTVSCGSQDIVEESPAADGTQVIAVDTAQATEVELADVEENDRLQTKCDGLEQVDPRLDETGVLQATFDEVCLASGDIVSCRGDFGADYEFNALLGFHGRTRAVPGERGFALAPGALGYALTQSSTGRWLSFLFDTRVSQGSRDVVEVPDDISANDVCPPFIAGPSWICTLPDQDTVECLDYDDAGDVTTRTYPMRRPVRKLVVGPEICALHQGSGISCLFDGEFMFVETKAEVLDFDWSGSDPRLTCIVDAKTRLKCAEDVFDPEARIHEEPYPYGTIEPLSFAALRPQLSNGERVGIVEVDMAFGRICGVTTDGHVECWGAPMHLHEWWSHEYLGRARLGEALALRVPGVENAVAVAQAKSRTCALEVHDDERLVRCWGTRHTGGSDLRPRRMFERGATDVAIGPAFGCAVVRGTPFCWGNNLYGLTASSDVRRSATPVDVGLPGEYIDVEVLPSGSSGFACAVTPAGAVDCWGGRSDGGLPEGVSPDDNETPLTSFRLVAAGARKIDRSVRNGVCLWLNEGVRCLPQSSLVARQYQVTLDGSPIYSDSVDGIDIVDFEGFGPCVLRSSGDIGCVEPRDDPGEASDQFPAPTDTHFIDVQSTLFYVCGITDDNRVGCFQDGSEAWWQAPGDAQAVVADTEEPCVLASGEIWCARYNQWPPEWTQQEAPVGDVEQLVGLDLNRPSDTQEWCMIASDGSLTCQGRWTGSGHPDPAVPKVVEFEWGN